ncbi:hypothetical protein D3C78_1163040 [compost metagenome]
MVGALLADEDAFRVATHQLHQLRRHQIVVQHHVGLLHQAQGAEGEQVGVAGAGTDQVHRAGRRAVACGQPLQQVGLGGALVAVHHLLRQRPFQHRLPERAPFLDIAEARLDLVAETRGKLRQAAEAGRDQAFQPRTDQPRQHRHAAAGRYRDHQRRAVDDGRRDVAGQLGVIHHIDRNAQRLRRLRHQAVDLALVGGGHHQPLAADLCRLETGVDMAHLAGSRHRGQLRHQLRRHHRQPGAGRLQQARLAHRHLAAADQQARLAGKAHENRKILHGMLL